LKMEYDHKSVLLAEVLQQLIRSKDGTFVDCTLGGAGHARAILENTEAGGFLIGIEKDIAALNAAKIKLKNFSQQILLIQGDFKDLDALLQDNVESVDGFLFDLGVSSMQLDIAGRGFSYRHEGPLDMRMDVSQKLTAYDVVNTYSKADLTKVIRQYGEERWASRIAAFIVRSRERQLVETTDRLVEIIKEAIPASARRKGGHPAKRTFQALRIEVNEELKALESALWQAPKWLKSGGRIVIISYHSLEDRLVKQNFRKLAEEPEPKLKVITRKPVVPDEKEIAENPRARSAKMRVAEKV